MLQAKLIKIPMGPQHTKFPSTLNIPIQALIPKVVLDAHNISKVERAQAAMRISLRRLADFVNAVEVSKEVSKDTNLLEAYDRDMVHLPLSPEEGRYKDDEETSLDEEEETMEETTGSKDEEWTG